MQNALALIHGVDYLFLHFLLGAALFSSCIVQAGGPAAFELDATGPRRIRILLGLTFLSSLSWMVATSSDMSESWKWPDLWQVMGHTEFGHLWCIRIGMLLFLFVFSSLVALKRQYTVFVFFATLGLVVISGLTGHAGSQDSGTIWRVPLFWLHSVAAGVWTGGLFSLFFWLGARISRSDIDSSIGHSVVKRFSHFAMASTGIIFLTGLTAAVSGGVSVWRPWATTYGQLILAKTFFFSLTLAAAAINQFVHLKNASTITDLKFSKSIRREVLIEITLVILVFGIVGYLTRTDLPMP